MRIWAVFVLLSAASAQTFQISSPSSSQVIQRSPGSSTDVLLQGTAAGVEGAAAVEARMSPKGPGWTPVGKVEGGRWSGSLKGVRDGGPYEVEVRVAGVRNSQKIQEVFVGDIWVLAGQSNMQGVGNLIDVETPDPRVHTMDMVDEKWQVAREPLHNLAGAVDRVHWPLNAEKQPERYIGTRLTDLNNERKKGAGLGLPFAKAMLQHEGVPIGLLPCAHGGTSMDQWDPEKWDRANPGNSLYGSMMRRYELAGGKARGILWYQGESDASSIAAPLFAAKFEKLVARTRADFNNPKLEFHYVQIGRHLSNAGVGPWNDVQEAQRILEARLAPAAMFVSIDSSLDDGIHVSTTDLKRLGRQIAMFAAGKAKRGPRPVAARVDGVKVVVDFEEGNGNLTSLDRPSGFSIHDAAGAAVPMIFRTELDGTRAVLHIGGKLPEGATLRYGAGKDPYCNIRDGKGMAVPVFGPMALK